MIRITASQVAKVHVVTAQAELCGPRDHRVTINDRLSMTLTDQARKSDRGIIRKMKCHKP